MLGNILCGRFKSLFEGLIWKIVHTNLVSFPLGEYCRGTRIKTRKRNIAAPLDPASFSDAVVQIYLDNGGDLVRRVKEFCDHI
jgi:hypothetical protein